MPSGREFHYQIEGEAVRFSCHHKLVEKATVEEAFKSMPCESFQELPKSLKPRNALWTLLSDTRIYHRKKFAEYEPSPLFRLASFSALDRQLVPAPVSLSHAAARTGGRSGPFMSNAMG